MAERVVDQLETVEVDQKRVTDAQMQLERQGLIYRYAAENDFFKVPWPKFVRTLRLMEMRGVVRGGRFVEGLWGEQFADPAAVPQMIATPKGVYKEESALDPVGMSARLLTKLGVLVPPQRTATSA